MAPIASGHILVTGATGFIATWVCKYALGKGFQVTGTVRSPAKGEYLKKLLGEGFDYVIVKDIAEETAFDSVTKAHDFDAVLHTASPVDFTVDHPNELIEPAVKGTIGILKSITKAGGDSVKRVVVTSSTSAVQRPSEAVPGKVFNEDDWNTESTVIVEEQGRDADQTHKYNASKTLAERAAWDYMAETKPLFDLITINPTFVYGPILHPVDSLQSLNFSTDRLWQVAQGSKTKEDLLVPASCYVDVRDVANAHVEALLRDVKGRFILSAAPFAWQDVVSVLNRDYKLGLVESTQEEADAIRYTQSYVDGTKAHKELGIDYIGLEQCVKDTYESVLTKQANGWK